MGFQYEDKTTPARYICSACSVSGVKLWRGYQESRITLLCVECVGKAAGKPIDWAEGDSCGWHVPAVPDEEGVGYWGYSSVPLRGCRWWHLLVPHAPPERHPEYFLDDAGWLAHLFAGADSGPWYLRRYFKPEARTVALRTIRARPADETRAILERFRTRPGHYRICGRLFRTAALARRWIAAL